MHPTLRLTCAVLLVAGSAACSSSDGNAADASTDSTLDTSPLADAAPDSGGTDGGTDAGLDASSCATDAGCIALTTLHPPKLDGGAATVFCPFGNVDGGKSVYCDPSTTHCCSSTQGGGSCVANQTACAGGDIDWNCADPVADCPLGRICCGRGTFVPGPNPACGNSASCFTGTYCAATCKPDELILCTSTAECPNAQTCTPFKAGGNQVGACR